MRADMPTVATWIDDLREAFGAEAVNDAIRTGMAGHPTFFARENGHEVGTPIPYRPECGERFTAATVPQTKTKRS